MGALFSQPDFYVHPEAVHPCSQVFQLPSTNLPEIAQRLVRMPLIVFTAVPSAYAFLRVSAFGLLSNQGFVAVSSSVKGKKVPPLPNRLGARIRNSHRDCRP